MTRNRNISWLIRIGIAAFWFLVIADAIPLTSALIDAEVWLTNHFSDPILLAFASGLLLSAVLSHTLRADLRGIFATDAPEGAGGRWSVRLLVVVIWLLVAVDFVPEIPVLTNAEMWLTIRFGDPILLAFACSLLLMALTGQTFRDDVALLFAPRPADVVPAADETLAEAAALQALVDETLPAEARLSAEAQLPAEPEPWELPPDEMVSETGPVPVSETVVEALPEAAEERSEQALPPEEIVSEALPEVAGAEPVSVPEVAAEPELPLGEENPLAPVPEPWELSPDEVVSENETELPPAEETIASAPEPIEVRVEPTVPVAAALPEASAPDVTEVHAVVLPPVETPPPTEPRPSADPEPPAPEPWELTPDAVVSDAALTEAEEVIQVALPEATETESVTVPEVTAEPEPEIIAEVEPSPLTEIKEVEARPPEDTLFPEEALPPAEPEAPVPEPWELTPDAVVSDAAPTEAEEVIQVALPKATETESVTVPEVTAEPEPETIAEAEPSPLTEIKEVEARPREDSLLPEEALSPAEPEPPVPEPWELTPDEVVADGAAEALPPAEAAAETVPQVAEAEVPVPGPVDATEASDVPVSAVEPEASAPYVAEVEADELPQPDAEAVEYAEEPLTENLAEPDAPEDVAESGPPAPEPWELTPEEVVAEGDAQPPEEVTPETLPQVAEVEAPAPEPVDATDAADVPVSAAEPEAPAPDVAEVEADGLPQPDAEAVEYAEEPLTENLAEPDASEDVAETEPLAPEPWELTPEEVVAEDEALPQADVTFQIDNVPVVVRLSELGRSAPLVGRDPLPDVPLMAGSGTEEHAPPQYTHWDTVKSFAAWQVAWLWNNWEPEDERIENGQVLSTYMRLESLLNSGTIRDVSPVNGDWKYAEISRQMLVNYAILSGERPKFLFAEHRGWLFSRLRGMQGRDVPLSEIHSYMVYGDVKLTLYKVLKAINSDAVASELRAAMQKGLCEGIARKVDNGITYGYERIPRYLWYTLKIDWLGNLSGLGMQYTGLMVKFKPGYPHAPGGGENEPSSVAAYDKIEQYVRPETETSETGERARPLAPDRNVTGRRA